MKHVKRLLISFMLMFYVSFLLVLFGITLPDSLKYLFMMMCTVLFIFLYFFIIKKIKWNSETRQIVTVEKKEKMRKKINIIKKIVEFFVYLFMIICLLLGVSNDGEFIVNNIYPFFQKMVTNNEIFNWIIIISPLCYIVTLYNIYDTIIKIITEKYGLSNKTEDDVHS